MKIQIYRTIIFLFSLALLACEDKINPQLESAEPVLVVDGWLNNKPGPQVIILTKTQGYFDGTLPPAVSGAIVSVTESGGKVYSFSENSSKPGNYIWTPTGSEVFGLVGKSYKLSIQLAGETFEASSRMGRVPAIDSITFLTEKRIASKDSLTRAEFWATDPAGSGDTYWIRSYKNGVALAKPSEINVAFDGAFDAGGTADGVIFIPPIRRGVNSRDEDDDGRQKSPLTSGDSINIQIHSVTLQAFNYLKQVSVQTNRPGGFQELFSTPLANVSTNISNTNSGGSKALGFFNVSAVSVAGKRYVKKK